MKIINASIAGTLESSDVQVTIEPLEGEKSGVNIDIKSSVINQYGRQIKKIAEETLEQLGVASANVIIVDKGALDCTIKARLECAVYRAVGFEGSIPWKAVNIK